MRRNRRGTFLHPAFLFTNALSGVLYRTFIEAVCKVIWSMENGAAIYDVAPMRIFTNICVELVIHLNDPCKFKRVQR